MANRSKVGFTRLANSLGILDKKELRLRERNNELTATDGRREPYPSSVQARNRPPENFLGFVRSRSERKGKFLRNDP